MQTTTLPSLNDQLARLREERSAKRPAAANKIMAAGQLKVAVLNIDGKSLSVGQKIPAFTLGNAVGKKISSTALLSDGPLVISFYRGAWCPYCNLELHTLQQELHNIQAAGGQLVAITPNLPDTTLTSIEKHSLEFQVLSDVGNAVARQFGLVFTVDPELQELYTKAGLGIPEQNGSDSWELPVPATYVVNAEGVIIYHYVNIDYTQRAEPADIIAALQTLTG
jgi:peroxiredoxin